MTTVGSRSKLRYSTRLTLHDMSESDLRSRLTAERGIRKMASDLAEFKVGDGVKGKAQVTNDRRRDQLLRVTNELAAPTTPRPFVGPPAPSGSGTPVEFSAWEGGVVGTITLLVSQPFTPS